MKSILVIIKLDGALLKFNNVSSDFQINDNKLVSLENITYPEAKVIVLEAIGYPFACNLIESPEIEIKDKTLFEIYAREQWEGEIVSQDSYLFDQKILPDFGFKVVNVHPEPSKIGSKSSIVLIDDEKEKKPEDLRYELHLSDIVGQEDAKKKSKIIIKYLDEPEKFSTWAPKNVLFYGPPGTGKTMLAKSLANELDVPLYLIKATKLIGDHVGDGARQIHELFEFASKNSPSIIFIDEFDAIALDRNYQSIRGDVSEIVNALLTEMDGIGENNKLVTIAATNNPLSLDFAIRSRFEDEIEFKLPTEEDRKEMLMNHISTLPLKLNFDLKKLVKLSEGMSGRDIKEKLIKSALHKAISEDKSEITEDDIEYALKNYKKDQSYPKEMFA